MLWIARTGAPWRELPWYFPKWKSVYTRMNRWAKAGIWQQVLAFLAKDRDSEVSYVDASYVRVHADGTKSPKGYAAEAIGRSRGGLTTKIHLQVDALGCPLRVVITGGERADVTQVPAFLPEEPGWFVCDRGYDADWVRERVSEHQGTAVIPGRKNRIEQPDYDQHWYRSRHLVENTLQRLKSARRIATRYEQTVGMYSAFVHLACVMFWLW